MGVPVSKLSDIMTHSEMLFHLDDLEQELPINDLLNILFARLNKTMIDCSDATADSKKKFTIKDFMLDLEGKKVDKEKNIMDIARANKYKRLK
jgi:hypothetical protein